MSIASSGSAATGSLRHGVLVQRPGELLSKSHLLAKTWGFDAYHTNLVEVHVSALRRKLEVTGPRMVHTAVGKGGYVFRADADD